MAHGYFVLGNGGAAIHAIKSIRSVGYSGDLHQISDDSGPAFNPMVAPYFLSEKTSWDTCFPFGDNFIEEHQIIAHHGDKVVSLDADSSTITTAGGKDFNYDKCLIATGAHPVMPPIPGLAESGCALPLREPETAQNMLESLSTASKVLVLGASFVGVKLAEVFLKKGIRVVLADIAPQLMPQGAHKNTAHHVERYLRDKGIDIRLNCSLSKVEAASGAALCHFPDGSTEKVDFIAVSAGIRPNLEFLDSEQVKINRAVCTNVYMQTNKSNLYAAGDVCESFDRLSSSQRWMGTWPNACYQGRVAGLNMAGVLTRYAGSIPQHVSPIFSWTYMQIGDALREGSKVRHEEHGDPFTGPYKIIVYDDDTLVGANLINNAMDLAWIKKEMNEGLGLQSHIPLSLSPVTPI